jgi:hypothetical protein
MAPREHGAYGQLGFPIVTALLLGRPTVASAAIALASVLAFLAHEPLLVVLGQRGGRALREGDARARARLAGLVAAACVAVVAGAVLATPHAREALALPFIFALVVLWLIARKWEKTLVGELLVGSTLSACSVPVALAGGVGLRCSLGAGAVWILGFGCATIAVRGVIARAKLGSSGPLVPALSAVAASAALLILLGWTWHVAWALPAAAAPNLAASLALSLRPPPPQKLRSVGWMLIVASAACAAILVVGLRSTQ